MSELMARGPVSAAMYVFTDFMHYSGGVYERTAGSAAVISTATSVALVGFSSAAGLLAPPAAAAPPPVAGFDAFAAAALFLNAFAILIWLWAR